MRSGVLGSDSGADSRLAAAVSLGGGVALPALVATLRSRSARSGGLDLQVAFAFIQCLQLLDQFLSLICQAGVALVCLLNFDLADYLVLQLLQYGIFLCRECGLTVGALDAPCCGPFPFDREW